MFDNTLSRRKALQFGAAAAGLTLLPGTRRAAAQDATITFWNTGYPIVDPNDKAKKPEDFYISKSIARFQEANPGVTVQMEAVPGNGDMFTKYRTASVAANGPDVMGMWSGSYMLGLIDFLEPLNTYFSPEERSRMSGWEATSADFRMDSDQIYGVPAGSDGTTCIFYNKESWAKAGVDPEASWPGSFDEFVAMLETIKASGVTPMALDDNAHHLADPGLVAGANARRLGSGRQARHRGDQFLHSGTDGDRRQLAEAQGLHHPRRRDDAGRRGTATAHGRAGDDDDRWLLGDRAISATRWARTWA